MHNAGGVRFVEFDAPIYEKASTCDVSRWSERGECQSAVAFANEVEAICIIGMAGIRRPGGGITLPSPFCFWWNVAMLQIISPRETLPAPPRIGFLRHGH